MFTADTYRKKNPPTARRVKNLIEFFPVEIGNGMGFSTIKINDEEMTS